VSVSEALITSWTVWAAIVWAARGGDIYCLYNISWSVLIVSVDRDTVANAVFCLTVKQDLRTPTEAVFSHSELNAGVRAVVVVDGR
jgi:hypothetical protein